MSLRAHVYTLILLSAVLLSGCGTATRATPSATPSGLPEETSPGGPLYTPTPEPVVDAPAWSSEGILYEVLVRSFYDADGDGTGDLDGVTAQLDYLEGLRAGVLWLLPIHPSPIYHGYDVTDYLAVNPDLGTLEDMQDLVEAAHEKGIRVIMDLVVNHTSDEHPFFEDARGNPQSRFADWYLWTNDAHTAYQAFGGYRDMPKLNHQNPEVVDYVLEIARFWMDLDGDGDYTDGVDGFRCDVAKEVPLSTWQALRKEMRDHNPDSFLLGEVWDMNARNLTKWYDEAFDALFNFPLYGSLAGSNDSVEDSALAGAGEPKLARQTVLAQNSLFPPGYQIVQFLNNHDTDRVMSDVGGDWERARTAATLLLTLPGTPMIYYGEEIGAKGTKGKGNPYWDEYRREPMDWYAAETGPGMTTWFKPGDRNNKPGDGISVEEQSGVAGSLLEHYRALAALRMAHPALLRGSFAAAQVTGSEMVLAYTRHAPASDGFPEEVFPVVLNLDFMAQEVTLELSRAYAGPFVAVDALSGEAWPDVPTGVPYAVKVPARSGLVLQLSRP
ncbi:MAG TPA: alpha-amylase family glycosyl hydrolase [Anaerolineae bacterium]|nr:alpha-amylase family glycosyl hydrolase [Anaerolineae bacterium]